MKHRDRRPIAVLLIALLLLSSVVLPSFAQDKTNAPRGDVNGDGKVRSDDARLTLRYAARLVSLTEEELRRADLSGNGKVNAGDARMILQIAAKTRAEVPFKARYIRTNGSIDGVQYPVVTLIENRAELGSYYETNKEEYSFDSTWDQDVSFRGACDGYDDAFFAEHDLVLILLEESSGSYRHEVKRVERVGGGLEICVDRLLPGNGCAVTCDMAEWHILVEIEKGLASRSEDVYVSVGAVYGPDAPDDVFETEPTGPAEPGTTSAEPSVEPTKTEPTTASPTVPVEFCAQYIRTDGGYADYFPYPVVTAIKDRAELDAYYAKYQGTYDLERHEQVYVDTTVGFLDACDKYDDAFFEKNDLILVLTEEPSGSIRHLVTDVRADAVGGLEIIIARILPHVGTDDMADWHIMIEVAKDPLHAGRDLAVSFREIDYNDEPDPAAPYIPGATGAQYIRTSRSAYDEVETPAVTLIRSRAELEDYYDKNDAEFSFDAPYDAFPSFRDACAKYDDVYFTMHDLLIVFIEEGSGSIRHEVTGVRQTPEGWQISITVHSPFGQTCDMAYWQIPIEIEKRQIADASDVSVRFDGRRSYDFGAAYVRTDRYGDNIGLPEYSIVDSRAGLDAYIDRVKEAYAEAYPGQEQNDIDEFVTACETYDEKYFAWHDLVLLVMTEPSGSIRHEVTDVFRTTDRDDLQIAVSRIEPTPQTGDAAQWHILVELEKDIVAPTDRIVVALSTVEQTSETAPDDTTVPPETEQSTKPQTVGAQDAAIRTVLKEKYRSESPDGLIHLQSYVLLEEEEYAPGEETVYLLVYHMAYNGKGEAVEEQGVSAFTAMTFTIDGDGGYMLKDYRAVEDDGSGADEIFPAEAATEARNTEKYAEALKQDNLEQLNAFFENLHG